MQILQGLCMIIRFSAECLASCLAVIAKFAEFVCICNIDNLMLIL